MNRAATILTLLAVIATAPGCLRVQNVLHLKADGSGEITLQYSVSTQAIRQMEAVRKLKEQLERASGAEQMSEEETRLAYLFLLPDEDALRAELERYADQGIRIDELDVSSSGAWRTVKLKITFRDLTELAATKPFEYVGFDLRRDSKDNYVFYRASKPAPGYNPPDFENPAVRRMLRPIFNGFRVVISLRTPGRVIRTNAHHHRAYVSEWVYDFERDPGVVAKLHTDKLVTIFDSSGLNLPEIRH